MRSLLLAMLAALLAAAPALAEGPPQTPPSAASNAARLCTELQQKDAAKFSAKFGSYEGCVSQVSGLVQAALDKCGAQKPCFERALQDSLKSLLAPQPQQPTASSVATRTCGELQTKDAAKFTTRFGSLDACVGRVSAIVQAALDKCAAQKECFERALQDGMKALLAPVREQGTNAAEVAGKACAALEAKSADAFARVFSSLDACTSRVATSVQTALDACRSQGNPKSCYQGALERALHSLAPAKPDKPAKPAKRDRK